jgi:hypothetical protein
VSCSSSSTESERILGDRVICLFIFLGQCPAQIEKLGPKLMFVSGNLCRQMQPVI